MRFLGIDFGEKRIGVAISDEDARIATPLTTLRRRSDSQAIQELVDLIRDEEIQALVIGEPRRADGSRGTAALRVIRFAVKLADSCDQEVFLVDESLTSREATQLAGSRLKRREQLDALAAQILLQEALDSPRSRTSLEEGRTAL